MKAILLVILSALLTFSCVAPAAADQSRYCASLPQLVDELAETWGESRVAAGLSAQGMLFQVFESSEGTWTLVVSDPTGRACPLAAGTNWETYPVPKTGTKG